MSREENCCDLIKMIYLLDWLADQPAGRLANQSSPLIFANVATRFARHKESIIFHCLAIHKSKPHTAPDGIGFQLAIERAAGDPRLPTNFQLLCRL